MENYSEALVPLLVGVSVLLAWYAATAEKRLKRKVGVVTPDMASEFAKLLAVAEAATDRVEAEMHRANARALSAEADAEEKKKREMSLVMGIMDIVKEHHVLEVAVQRVKDIFGEAGVALPDDPEDWDEAAMYTAVAYLGQRVSDVAEAEMEDRKE
jgi:PAB1-binding protein PBP1